VESGDVILSGGPYGRLSVTALIRLGQPATTIPTLAAQEEFPISGRELERSVTGGQDERGCGF
jgi:hypothetical protein